jgi:NADH-quinone oxidoreductase subunit N
MNTGAFAVLAYLKARGRDAEELSDVAGLARTEPVATLVIALSMFSLMGMPLTAGFWGKVYLFSGALSMDPGSPHGRAFIVLAVIAALNSAVGAAYYLRVIATCYLAEPKTQVSVPDRPWLRLGLAICGVFVLGFGVWPRELLRVARVAGEGAAASAAASAPPNADEARLAAERAEDAPHPEDAPRG